MSCRVHFSPLCIGLLGSVALRRWLRRALSLGRCTVVEYKTGEASKASATTEQLRLYGQALQIATDLPVVVKMCSVG